MLRGIDQRAAGRTAVTLAVSAAGGTLAHWAGLPAAWVSGGLLAVAVASLAGLNTRIPPSWQPPVFLILGLYAGSGVTEETLNQMRTWPASFAILGASLVVLIAGGYWWLHRRCGWSRSDAMLATLPGALPFVIAAAEGLQADMKKVAIAQSIRLIVLVETIPLVALLIGHPTLVTAASIPVAGPYDLVLMLALGAAVSLVMTAIRMPAGWMIGGLLASAALRLAGVLETQVPALLTVPSMICIGAIAGSRFRPGDIAILPRLAGPAFGALAIACGVSAASALVVTLIFGIGIIQTLLAFAPGAQDVLTILALQMNIDPAYVAAHQIVRFLALVAVVPILARWLRRQP